MVNVDSISNKVLFSSELLMNNNKTLPTVDNISYSIIGLEMTLNTRIKKAYCGSTEKNSEILIASLSLANFNL
ncbi:unnamed protein product [Schistosoma intercalatum]|nr:unnamed protein product [Schistosoma intercalatum]